MRRRSTDIIVVFVILLLGSVLLAQDLPAVATPSQPAKVQDAAPRWVGFTNANYVRKIALQGDYLWAATSGGVLARNLTDGTYVKFTTTDDGLADNDIYSVFIDGAGYKWFGTYGGVSVLDDGGTPLDKTDDTWIAFTSADGPVGRWDIVMDEAGRKWFADWPSVLDDGGTPFDKSDDQWQSFTTADGLACSNRGQTIVIDEAGLKWIGCGWDGMSVLDDGGTPFDKSDDRWQSFNKDDGMGSTLISSIAIDGTGRKWIGSWSSPGGVSVLDDNGTPFDKSDDQWQTFFSADSGLVNDGVWSVVIDGAGRKWFGTNGGVSVLDDNGTLFNKADDTWITFTTADGLANDTTYDIIIDGSGRKWFGTFGGGWFGTSGDGVSMLNDNGTPFDKADDLWQTLGTNDGLANNNINTIVIDGAGRKWIGAQDGGANALDDNGTPSNKADDQWVTFTVNDGLPAPIVYAIAIDGAGRKWFGGHEYRVSVLDDNGTPFDKADDQWCTFTDADGLAGITSDIAIDGAGRKWFGTWWGGVSVLDDNGTPCNKADDQPWITFTTDDGLVNNFVRSIAIDGGGRKWFGAGYDTEGGLSVLDDNGTPFNKADDTWNSFTTADGLVTNLISDIVIDINRYKWIGLWSYTGEGGVCVLNDGGTPFNKTDDIWTCFTTADGLANNWVNSVAIDGFGRKWIATRGGVSVLDDNGTPFNKADDTWTTYTTVDGLTSNFVNSVVIDGVGNKWFGTAGGVSVLLDDAALPTPISFPVGNHPVNVIHDGTHVWVTNYHDYTVTKLRASDGQNLGTFTVEQFPYGLAFDGTNIWVTNYGNASISKLRAIDGVNLGSFPVDPHPWPIVYDGANLWVTNWDNNIVHAIRPSDGTTVCIAAVGTNHTSIAFDGTYIWVADRGANTIRKLQANDCVEAPGSPFIVGNQPGVAYGLGYIWVTSPVDKTVSKVRTSDGALLDTYSVGFSPGGIAFDSASAWVISPTDNTVTRLRASDGANLGTVIVGTDPEGITFDGTYIWVTNAGSNTVSRIRVTVLTPTPTPTPTPTSTPAPTSTLTPTPTITPTSSPPSGADIRVTPTAVEVTLPEGQSTTVPLAIGNAGGAALTFSIAKEQGSTGAGVQGGEGEREKGKKGKRGQRSRGAGEHGSEGDVKPVLRPVEVVDPALLDALDAAPDGQVAFFVYLKEQADLSPAYAIQDWKARGEFVYHTLRETAQRSQKELLADLRQQQLAGTVTDYQPFFILNAVAVIGGRSAVDALAARPDVAYLAPEPVFHIPEPLDEKPTSAAPNGVEWNVAQVRADQVWADGITGAGVVVANIDTGVDASHPALVSQYRGTATGSHDYNWFDPTGHYPTVPGDNHGHGTHVMGTMVGDDGAGNQIGVAPGAQWIAAKGCAGRGCAGSDLLAAAEWVLAPCPIGVAPGDPACDAAKRPQVVNNSWGGAGGDPWFESMVSAWRAAGIFPAFAAGNSGPGDGTVGSPGDYATSFASGATDQADTICWFSSRGPSRLTPETKPDLAAPGCRGIRSALPGGSYGTKNGTSMASPHTAGVVALLLQANPGLTVEEIEALLTSTALDLGPQGPDKTYGHGRLDAYAAVSQAGDPVPWLVVDPTSGTVNPGNQTEVTLTLDAAGLSTGTHTADLVITSNDPDEPTVTVPVTLTVTSGSPTISHVRVSNLRDVSASVSWITTVDADGRVYYGTDPASLTNVAHDDRGAGIEDDVHHVTIGGLTPNTTYYFYVVSDGASDDNEGQYYQFTTGAPLSVPGSDSVWGQVFKGDGVTPAADVLVYLQVLNNDASGSPGQSGLLSGLTDSNGFWIDSKTGGAVNLAAVRTEDGGSYFVYSESGDALRIEVQGAAECEGLMQVDTADDRPAPDISLSCLNMINLDITTGWSVFVWPAVPSEAYDASDLLGAILDAGGDVPEISQWMSELGNWSGHLRGLPFGDFEVAPGEPYFLRSTRRSLLRLEAGVGIAQSEAITLTTGWNFAALPRTAGVMTAEAACEQIATQGGAVEEIDRWDANVGNWAGHICGLPFGDFEVTPEEGYFVKSGADSVWRPSGGAGVQGSTGAGEKGRKGKREQGNTATRDPLFPYSLIPLFPYSLIPLSTFPIVGEVEIRNVRVTNVTDRSFSVVWETDRAVPGWVRFATIRNPKPVLSPVEVSEIRNWMVAYDDRGAEVAASTHHVTVAGLSPGTSYSFAVVSGTTKEDNGGQLYRVSTGPTLGIPAVQTAYGRVLGTDGETSVVGALVLLLLRDGDGAGSPGESAPLSAVTDEQGYWSVNLGAARTVAGDAHFTSDGADRVAVRAWHPALGWAVEEVTLNELPAALPLELRVAWQTHLPFVVRR